MKLLHLLKELLTAECAAVYPRLPFSEVASPAELLRRHSLSSRFCHHKTLVRAILNAIVFANWPLRLLLMAKRCTGRWGAEIERRSGKGKLTQIKEQLWFGIRHSIPPTEYYRYEMYMRSGAKKASQFLHQAEAQSLFRLLNSAASQDSVSVVQDKLKFADWCVSHNFASPPVIAYVCNGQLKINGEHSLQHAPSSSVFFKPARGSRGEGAEIWRLTEAGEFANSAGACVSWRHLMGNLASKSTDFIVQPLLMDDSRIADLSGGGLSAVRIVTGRHLDGEIECVAATYKMSWKNQATNTHGLCSAIDLTSGKLSQAWSYRPVCAGYNVHPDTSASISQRVIPEWPLIVTLAKRAHSLLPDFVFIGWDIALTSDGVVLVEANTHWDVPSMQRPQGQPLPQTEFGRICIELLESNLAG